MYIDLKYWRTKKALSIRDLVKLAGVSSQTVVNIEKYGTMPTPAVTRKLAKALDMKPEELVQEGEPPKVDESPKDESLLATAV